MRKRVMNDPVAEAAEKRKLSRELDSRGISTLVVEPLKPLISIRVVSGTGKSYPKPVTTPPKSKRAVKKFLNSINKWEASTRKGRKK